MLSGCLGKEEQVSMQNNTNKQTNIIIHVHIYTTNIHIHVHIIIYIYNQICRDFGTCTQGNVLYNEQKH